MRPSLGKIIKSTLKVFTKKTGVTSPKQQKQSKDNKEQSLSISLEINVETIRSYLSDSDDIIFRYINVPTAPSTNAVVIFIENLIDINTLESSVLAPLTEGVEEKSEEERIYYFSNIESLVKKILSISSVNFYQDATNVIDQVLAGKGILLVDGYSTAVSINITKGPFKEHTEPKTEKVIKGPQQGFVEDISTNIAMVRKRIKSPHLVSKKIQLGRESKTEINIMYMNNIADSSIVKEVFIRLSKIDVDGIIGSFYIEEYINDAPTNLFQPIFSTERPDRIQAMLLEGRIAIICDQTPFVLVVPTIISDFFISPEDYYVNYYFATFNRLLGYLGSFIIIFLPGIYVAFTTYHQEMIPTRLALTLAGTRAGVPYPAFMEAVLMEIAFEGLREAGTRLPTHVGQAISIVGALIIGQAAVEAGLVSPAVVIIVATTAVFSFTIPYSSFSLALRLTRFFIMSLAAILGIYGIMTGALIIGLNLMSLRSFGVPFMIPFAPLSLEEMKDWFVRFPQWGIRKRSSHFTPKNITKKPSNLKPSPPSKGGHQEL